jgi:hypothetical protein
MSDRFATPPDTGRTGAVGLQRHDEGYFTGNMHAMIRITLSLISTCSGKKQGFETVGGKRSLLDRRKSKQIPAALSFGPLTRIVSN